MQQDPFFQQPAGESHKVLSIRLPRSLTKLCRSSCVRIPVVAKLPTLRASHKKRPLNFPTNERIPRGEATDITTHKGVSRHES